MRFLVLLALLLAPSVARGQAGPSAPALLRPHALVQGAAVLLSDLFVGAPESFAFPAPPPGRRLVVEPYQIAAIARSHGIHWRPLPGAERIVVERPGQTLPRATAEAALRAALLPLGGGAEDGFDFASALPMVAASFPPFVSAEDAVLETQSGRFAATLVLESGEASPQRVRIVGRVWRAVPAAVAVRRMAVGEVFSAGDFRIDRVRADRAGSVADPDRVAGMAARRPVSPGQPLAATDLAPPTVIARNSPVVISIVMPGMSISAQGRALEDAAQGAPIRVQNLASRAVLEAEVLGPGRVRVAPGTMPVEVPPPGQNPTPVRR
jgi:flagella basal body P-ring formation protein FlgA